VLSPDANPIADRLEELHDQWKAFADDGEARLLRWLVEPDEVPLVEAFFTRESDPDAAQTPDLFIELDTPFADGTRHGLLLRGRLERMYEGDREALRAAGVTADWIAPPLPGGEVDDVAAWVATLTSFKEAHGKEVEKLAVWLRPDGVRDVEEYVLWLQRLVRAAPREVRFILVDDGGTAELEVLARHEPRRLKSEKADLDMGSAVEEISAAAGNLETSGGRFRHLYVQIGSAARKGDLPAAERLAGEAIVVAQGESWHHLVATVHFLMGSLLMQRQRNVEAVERFVAADKAAAASDLAGEPYGKKLRMQARMCAGSALLAEGAFLPAARAFTESVPLAQAAEDARAELDAWRLASYCHEQGGQTEQAWEAGLAGLQVGKRMDEETRRTSTLRFLAEGMMRLTSTRGLREYEAPMEKQLVALVGANWRA
jgi:hypothetical protein